MDSKSFKTTRITLALDRSEDRIFIDNNSLPEDNLVIVEQAEQPANKQDEGMKDEEINDNNNNSKEEDEEEKETVGIEYTEQKAGPENGIEFRWSDIWGEDEEVIAKAKFTESLQKQRRKKIFPKKVT